MLITAIEKSKTTNMVTVFVDHELSFVIPEDEFLRLHLYDRQEITSEEIHHIKHEISLAAAKAKALRFLALKIRSEKEIRDKLEMEGYPYEIVEKVIEDLNSLGYINDRIYAQKYLNDRSKLKPKAKKLLKIELQYKGISGAIIDDVLKEWDIDELSVAEMLVRKKFGKYNLEDEKVIRKIFSFLQNRGYSFDIIEDVIKKVKQGISND